MPSTSCAFLTKAEILKESERHNERNIEYNDISDIFMNNRNASDEICDVSLCGSGNSAQYSWKNWNIVDPDFSFDSIFDASFLGSSRTKSGECYACEQSS